MSDPQLTLRPMREEDLPFLDARSGPQSDPFNFFGHRRAGRARRQFDQDGMLGDDRGQLAVDVDGAFVGDVGWHPVHYGPQNAGYAFNIGIGLLAEYRGKGYGTAAQRELAAYLFGVYAVNRLEASTDVTNIAEQTALVRAGFTREGVLRGSQFRAGSWHDMIIYSRLRSDA